MSPGNFLSRLAEQSIWGPAAEPILYIFCGAMFVFVISCVVAQILEDRTHPARTGRGVTMAR